MGIDSIIPFNIIKIPAPTFLTFHCAQGVADLTSVEGCTPSGFNNTHTYNLAIRQLGAPQITGIAGTVTAGPYVTEDDCHIQIKAVEDTTWATLLSFRTKKNNKYHFEVYPPFPRPVGMFRIWFDSSGQIIESEGTIQIGQTPMNQQPNQTACESAGGFWYNNSCHLTYPLCYIIDNEPDCTAYNCYWADGKCNPQPTSCKGWLTETDCTAHGCVWWDSTHPHFPNTCNSAGSNAVKLSMSPDDPADMYSITPPGSTYAEFVFAEKIKVYRGKGQVKIGRKDGSTVITDILFWLDAKGDLWQNRVRVVSDHMKSFDEDYSISSNYNRYGNIFRVGFKSLDVPVDYLNMVLFRYFFVQ